MRTVDLLSDTVYREQAHKKLNDMLGSDERFPVQKSQLYGLRQIARQAPGKVKEFADHQRDRARKRDMQAEIDFWERVSGACDERTTNWSVAAEGAKHLPTELREENIPAKAKDMTPADRTRRNQLRKRQRDWLERWKRDHIPAFFERFCAHALYLRERQERSR